MKTEPKSVEELEAEIQLKSNWLRATSLVAGSPNSSPAATKVAGNEAALLKQSLADLAMELEKARKAA